MTHWQKGMPVSDEILVAWLDNQLDEQQYQQVEKMLRNDPFLAERLARLDSGNADFAAAFAPLLEEAPITRLQQRLGGMLNHSPEPPARGISRRTLIAATLSALALGVVGGNKGQRLFDNDDGWRDTVAQYMALYTRETFEGVSPSASVMRQQLAYISRHLDLPLSPQALTLNGSAFKSARMLSYDDKAIAQIVWDERETGPLALCITATSRQASRTLSTETRRDMNVVYWQQQQHQFMLIGHLPAPAMMKLAQTLSASV
ncbi:anti-sigma factor [Erwinia pyri]|uniref:Anti-sigma factor n=1 Tax=Erwinia pyri TaxID=3062598 RepID=A0AA50DG29_9GAMM|nr:anti-sigma factor [Erwinia sp. DE2]WLS77714.1 anti-sigma factor [Erwinia sp. DE2]